MALMERYEIFTLPVHHSTTNVTNSPLCHFYILKKARDERRIPAGGTHLLPFSYPLAWEEHKL